MPGEMVVIEMDFFVLTFVVLSFRVWKVVCAQRIHSVPF